MNGRINKDELRLKLAGYRVAIMGPPGSGKDCQAEFLARFIGGEALSMSAILRKAAEDKDDEQGQYISHRMETGDLVPTDLVLHLLSSRLRRLNSDQPAWLNGFPRTFEQAEAFLDLPAAKAVVFVDVPSEVCQWRLAAGHRHRTDDQPEILLRRLRDYQQAKPRIKEILGGAIPVIEVDGDQLIPSVSRDIINGLNKTIVLNPN